MNNTTARDGFDLADQMRRSGVEWMSPAEVETLRAYLAAMTPQKRIRAIFTDGAAVIEGPIDEAWGILGRRPTAEEYKELAAVCRSAVRYCEREAAELEAPK